MTENNTGFGRRQPAPLAPVAQPLPRNPYLENRRPDIRASQLKNIKLIYNDGYCTLDAILRELSEHGAKIETTDALSVPDAFIMRTLQSGADKNCYLIWRDSKFLGVSFTPLS